MIFISSVCDLMLAFFDEGQIHLMSQHVQDSEKEQELIVNTNFVTDVLDASKLLQYRISR